MGAFGEPGLLDAARTDNASVPYILGRLKRSHRGKWKQSLQLALDQNEPHPSLQKWVKKFVPSLPAWHLTWGPKRKLTFQPSPPLPWKGNYIARLG